jgi:endonuclease III
MSIHKDEFNYDKNDPRQVLIQALLTSKTSDELFDRISYEIVDEDGAVNFYYFDVAMALLRAFYEVSKFPEEDVHEEVLDLQRRKANAN